MHWVIIIIIILVILVFVFAFLAATWIFWPPALITLFVFIAIYRSHKISGIQRDSGLAQVMIPKLQNDRINWRVDYNKLDEFAKQNLAEMMFAGWALSLAIPSLLTYFLYSRGQLPITLDDIAVSTPEEFGEYLITALIVAGIINGVILACYKPTKRFIDAVRNAAKDIKDRTGDSMEEIGKIKNVIDSMQEEAAKLKVSLSIDYLSEIYDYINDNGQLIFQQPQRLEEYVSERFGSATNDLKQLRQMTKIFSEIEDLYLDTVDHINSSGSLVLLDRAHLFGNFLHSENLEQLVIERRWDDFITTLSNEQTKLRNLRNIAMKLEPEENNDIEGAITHEKACKFLGIPPDSSIEEIKKTYHFLVKFWHSGPRQAGDDTQMKKLNDVQDFFKKGGLW